MFYFVLDAVPVVLLPVPVPICKLSKIRIFILGELLDQLLTTARHSAQRGAGYPTLG
jgi:hypothetical protein